MAASLDSEMCSRVPVIVILGATGSGKSKLAIEIARKYGGEILSADSMQVYRGLDIITNKVTAEEREQAPHHLLDVVEPPRPFSVVDFRDAALPILEGLLQQRKLPVVVGGTNYYIESLLWRVLVGPAPPRPPSPPKQEQEQGEVGGEPDEPPGAEPASKRPRLELDALPSPELHRRLQEVDPDMARRLHPNNRRRILRSLEVFAQLGRPHSDVLQEQRLSEGGSTLGGSLRYPHSAILWLQCGQEALDRRLDARVDDMLQRGLVAELLDFHARYNAQRLAADTKADYTIGIFQSIGFKEFHEYLLLDAEERQTETGRRLFQKAVDELKTVTRRYARKQLRWVTNRFLRRPDRQVPPVYALDTTDPSKWEEAVYKPATCIVDSLLTGTPLDIKPLPIEEALSNEPTSFHCDICDRVFIGNIQWQAHLCSKKHQRMIRKKQENSEVSESCDGQGAITEEDSLASQDKTDSSEGLEQICKIKKANGC